MIAPDHPIVQDLRIKFCRGSMPVTLIEELYSHWLQGRLGDYTQWQFAISEWYDAAFATPLMRLPDDIDQIRTSDAIRDRLNLDTLHTMIVNLDKWHSADPRYDIREQWLGSSTAMEIWQHLEIVKSTGVPELNEIWKHLDEIAREYAIRLLANCRLYDEHLQILNRLARRLSDRLSCVPSPSISPHRVVAESASSQAVPQDQN